MKTVDHNYTGYGSEGSQYQATKHLNVKEVAKLVRNDLKDPVFEGLKFSVRIDRFAGGQSLDVTVMDAPADFVVENPNYDRNDHRSSRYSDNAVALLKVVERVVNKYNYDDSNGMIDYFSTNFYSSVSFDWRKFNV